MRNHYAFSFTDGVNTTTELASGQLLTAGDAYRFPSRAARDAWVAAGVQRRAANPGEEFRLANAEQG